ncbi:uncharacterized protein LOC121837573, partial [Ixodes scapularis]|uniref:uncharacterized protein LOC121837573 n=1 Tax=Ixodes scapularis TaxID=6945 RepID=UPI001C38C640
IRPKLEYAAAIWDPYQNYLMKNLEAIQNSAVRFVYSDAKDWNDLPENIVQLRDLDKFREALIALDQS